MKLNSFSRINAPVLAPSGAMLQPVRRTVLDARSLGSIRKKKQAQFHKLCVAQASTEDAETQPVEDPRSGRTTYRPASFSEMIGDAVQSIRTGLDDGLMRMEVEFPAVSNVDGKNELQNI